MCSKFKLQVVLETTVNVLQLDLDFRQLKTNQNTGLVHTTYYSASLREKFLKMK